ncbi:alpha/beta fold hydrolase [Allokutzneria albata]|uniref:alpha/beta fold hydrolase n=1 Tax=Allokutzneria albata TaxID=211114 RepID=UPI000AF0F553|nr:alpha/beta hydrolase [Allokutzneria albata]
MERRDVVDFGGSGQPILLLHGLMGRARTWWPVAQWLKRYGRVHGLDQRGHGHSPHRGFTSVSAEDPLAGSSVSAEDPLAGSSVSTEDFVADAAELLTELGPAVVIGHSMGGLHAWELAAHHPDLVRAVVVEDMAPDQRGKTVDAWRGYFDSWPVPFESLDHVRSFFGGPVGDYFTECVTEREDGYHLMADLEDLYVIAAEWGRRAYWDSVEKVACPLLAIEAEHTSMPPGQIRELAERAPDGRYVRIEGAGHVIHRDRPDAYRGAVEAFLSS